MKPTKPLRRIKKLWVEFISLVDSGANRKTIIWKSVSDTPDGQPLNHEIKIAKVREDQRMVYGIVYAPEMVDTDGDIASAEVIKDAAYNFMMEKNVDHVDKQHNENPDFGVVVESWIVRKDDQLFPEPENVDAWAVGIYVKDDAAWDAIKKGEITGLSIGGNSIVEDLFKSDKEIEDMKITETQIYESVKKAFAEFRWAGEVGGGGGDTPPSIKADLEALLKEVKTGDEAVAAMGTLTEFAKTLNGDALEVFKSKFPDQKFDGEPAPAPAPAKDDAPGDSADVIKAMTDSLAGALQPLNDTLAGIDARLKVVEKAGSGRVSDLPVDDHGTDSDEGAAINFHS